MDPKINGCKKSNKKLVLQDKGYFRNSTIGKTTFFKFENIVFHILEDPTYFP